MVGQEQLIGNLLFYEYLLCKRNPTFLNRNLTRSLELHRQALEPTRIHYPTSVADDRTKWRYMDKSEFETMNGQRQNDQAFILGIQSLIIHDARSRSRSIRPAIKYHLSFKIKVDIHVAIVDDGASKSATSHTFTFSNVGMIGTHSANGLNLSLEPQTHAFRLAEMLKVPGFPRRKRPKDWTLQVSIQLSDRDDAAQFYTYLAPSKPFLLGECRTLLSTQPVSIRDCEGNIVQPLSIEMKHGNEELGLSLGMNISWTNSAAESILETHNRGLSGSQCPTPPPQSPATFHKEYHLTIVHPGGAINRRGLKCPIDNCKDTFQRAEALFLHMESLHSLVKYTTTKDDQSPDRKVEYWTINLDVAEYQPERSHAKSARDYHDIQVIAPSEPFNEQRFLEGDDVSQRGVKKKKKGPIQVTRRVQLPPRLPNQVQDHTLIQKKTYCVPKAPQGTTFFRSISKRPLQEGEYVSESDDDVSVSWFEQKMCADLAAAQHIPKASQAFLKKYDTHMRHEHLHGTYYLGDALIRFVKSKGTSLCQESLVKEFKMKIQELLEDDHISKEFHGECVRLIDKQESTARTANKASRAIDKGKGKARAPTDGEFTPASDGDIEMRDVAERTRPPAPQFNRCLCGQDALKSGGEPYVACEGIVSSSCIESNSNTLTLPGMRALHVPHQMHQAILESCAATSRLPGGVDVQRLLRA